MDAKLIAGAMQAVPGADNDTSLRAEAIVRQVMAESSGRQVVALMRAGSDEEEFDWGAKKLHKHAVTLYRRQHYGFIGGGLMWLVVAQLVKAVLWWMIQRALENALLES